MHFVDRLLVRTFTLLLSLMVPVMVLIASGCKTNFVLHKWAIRCWSDVRDVYIFLCIIFINGSWTVDE